MGGSCPWRRRVRAHITTHGPILAPNPSRLRLVHTSFHLRRHRTTSRMPDLSTPPTSGTPSTRPPPPPTPPPTASAPPRPSRRTRSRAGGSPSSTRPSRCCSVLRRRDDRAGHSVEPSRSARSVRAGDGRAGGRWSAGGVPVAREAHRLRPRRVPSRPDYGTHGHHAGRRGAPPSRRRTACSRRRSSRCVRGTASGCIWVAHNGFRFDAPLWARCLQQAEARGDGAPRSGRGKRGSSVRRHAPLSQRH